ncbi:MAG: hypothetical protein G01um1014107_205 [Parcubacteria group bacterium Gr01-1014_107]|nr:MAG: hypothetical protein G01um1014107_205 [Parcubacteria group bacterium Gr01-1014_107]
MNQVQEGLFAVEEQMPCSPKAITVCHYVLPSTLDRMEREEAAARILSFSQQLDQWVGVSWPCLIKMMQKEYETYRSIEEAYDHNFNEPRRVRLAVMRHNILCTLTLGIYALFAAKPTAQMREIPDEKVPFSGIFMFGPQHVATGIRELIEKGMLRHVQEGEGESAFDVFCPTSALVLRIMQKQGVPAS